MPHGSDSLEFPRDQRRMIVLTGHRDPVNSLAFSPDGSILASGGDDGCIWIWDAAAGHARSRLSWGARFVFGIAWSGDGRSLAAGVEDNLILLRADDEWRPVHRWRKHQGWVTCAAFSPDSQMLLSGGVDGVAYLWDAVQFSKRPLTMFVGGFGSIRSIIFAPDGRAIGAGGATGVGVWKASVPEPVLFNRLRDADVRSVAFSPDGRLLVAAAGRCVISVDPQTHRAVEVLQAPANYFRCVAFTPDGKSLAIGCEDGTVRLWDTETSEEREAVEVSESSINCVAVSPDQQSMAAAGDDFVVRLWDL